MTEEDQVDEVYYSVAEEDPACEDHGVFHHGEWIDHQGNSEADEDEASDQEEFPGTASVFLKFQASFEAPDAVYQDKGSKQDRQELDHDLRVHEEEDSDNHENTARKKIQDRRIQFFQNIDQDMIKSYKNQQNSKYKFTDYIDRVHRHKRQARSKGDIYDRGYNLPF